MYKQTIFDVFVLSIYLLIPIQALKVKKPQTQSTCFLQYKPIDGWSKVKKQQENQYFPWFKTLQNKNY